MLTLRDAIVGDGPLLCGLIYELAVYEKLEDEAKADPAALEKWLFGSIPIIYAVLAEWDGVPIGFVLYYYNFSTFQGVPGCYVEDLYVQEEHRGKGAGLALLKIVAERAIGMGFGRVEWSVLDWNEPSIEFYKRQGAVPMDEWTRYRLSDDALTKFGSN